MPPEIASQHTARLSRGSKLLVAALGWQNQVREADPTGESRAPGPHLGPGRLDCADSFCGVARPSLAASSRRRLWNDSVAAPGEQNTRSVAQNL
ncbi:hypothetical protein BJS_08301 [Bradyrhizobium japonicum SEMIA 5079]|uniref:Uncharacterized protein n=1 Tax=Bradyrhizobium diazoefficiens SEMIA 5080 TaxID=754504 RepID=A0A837CQ94_9BRAD|nr:hypothetical protein BJS_08301 [Bradyrhizobium japonicum SEMIA 5079]KGJ71506.1 hypothetical protein BJA5080_08023 [Bradyrhizobium diazoefficiens SEMIA 5080]